MPTAPSVLLRLGRIIGHRGADSPESRAHPKAPLFSPRASKASQTGIAAAPELSQQSLLCRGDGHGRCRSQPLKAGLSWLLSTAHGQAIKIKQGTFLPRRPNSVVSPRLGFSHCFPYSIVPELLIFLEQTGREKRWN